MRLVEITNDRSLEALRPEWEALWERCADAGPFQHPDWLLPWWKHFGDGALWTLALYAGGQLAAVAPFFLYRPDTGAGRQLILLGNGISDRLNIVAADCFAAEAICAYVAKRSDVWDRCDFRDLPLDSALISRWPDAFEQTVEDEEPCPVLRIPNGSAELAGIVPAKLLSYLANRWRCAAKRGALVVQRAEAKTLSGALDALIMLHARRWCARSETGVLADPSVTHFHREVAERFLRRGWLRLYVLRLNDEPIAACYGFHLRERCYYYSGGFDPRFRQLSPGALVVRHAIAEAARQGAVEFDFLRGAEPYKYRWGAQDRRQVRLQIRRAAMRASGAAHAG